MTVLTNVIIRAIKRMESLHEKPDWAVHCAFQDCEVEKDNRKLAEVMSALVRHYRGLVEEPERSGPNPKQSWRYVLGMRLALLNEQREIIIGELAKLDGVDGEKMKSWAQSFTEEVIGGPPFKVGDTVKHPSGRMVKIVDGQWWGLNGLSNFWYWHEIRSDGTLGARESGYGWRPTP